MAPEKRREEVQLINPVELSKKVNEKLLDPQTSIGLREYVAQQEWDAYEHFDQKAKLPSFYKDLI